MSNLTTKPRAHYAPIYAAALYPDLADIARAHGWALAVHGSLARDMDLTAIPWVRGMTGDQYTREFLQGALKDPQPMRIVPQRAH